MKCENKSHSGEKIGGKTGGKTGEKTGGKTGEGSNPYDMYFSEPTIENNVYTPTNITGMYRRLIVEHLAGTEYNETKVLPALNKEQRVDHGNTLVVVKRGALSDSGLGVKGGRTKLQSLPSGLPGADAFSAKDSESYSHLQNLTVECTVYGENLAEIESIAYLVYRLVLAYSNDILSKYTPGIKNVSSPTLSEAVPSKKHTDRYECYISFNVTFFDETILLMGKNMIKYLNITVSEDSSVNIISKDGKIKF